MFTLHIMLLFLIGKHSNMAINKLKNCVIFMMDELKFIQITFILKNINVKSISDI